MIHCDEARQRWHRHCDDGGVDAELERHLDGCDECRHYADEMSAIVGALDELSDATESVVAGPRRATPGRASPSVLIRLSRLTRAAAVLAVVASAAFYFVGRQADQSPPVGPSQPEPASAADTATRLGITLSEASSERMMAVALPTSDPDVQMYRLYRTVGPNEADGS